MFFKRVPFFIKVSPWPYFSSHTFTHITESQMFSALRSSTCRGNTVLQHEGGKNKNNLSTACLQVCGVSLQGGLLEIISVLCTCLFFFFFLYNFIQHYIRQSNMNQFLQKKKSFEVVLQLESVSFIVGCANIRYQYIF